MNMDDNLILPTLPPAIERYELKYVIPQDLVDPISDFLAPYCELDGHSAREPDHFYAVNSLYLDTPCFRFLKQRMGGADRRFNARVRAYGDGSVGPYYAEIKHKSATSIKKFRATLSTDEWPGFLVDSSSTASPALGDKERLSRNLFLYIASAYAIEPKIFTCYRRRAFASHMDDYARVTFDIDMRFRLQDSMCAVNPYSLDARHDCINYDVQNIYGDEARYGANVILELKATIGAVPLWMVELIRRFQLTRVGFSKYLNSSMSARHDNGTHYMDADRRAGVLA